MEIRQKTGVIALTITIIVLGVLYWYWDVLIPSKIVPISAPPEQVYEDMALKQLQELDALYKKSGVSPPSEAEAAKQLEELERLRSSK